MLQERAKLEDELYSIISDLNKTGSIKELIKSDLLNDYIDRAVLTNILNFNMPFNNMSKSDLYHICRLINNYQKKIEIHEYFSQEEQAEATNKKIIKIKSSPILEFENVIYSQNNGIKIWYVKVTYKEIYNMMKAGKLIYNMKTQRQGMVKKIGREMLIVPLVNEESVSEIKEEMTNHSFFPNMISFNIVPLHNEKLEYNTKTNILKIDTKIFSIAIIDGMHRISAAMRAIEEDNELEGEFLLKITNMTVEQAQSFIRQEAKNNAQNFEALQKFNPANKITAFINAINNMGSLKSNVLYRRIDTEINTPNTWILFEVFKEGLVLSDFMDDISKTDSDVELGNMELFIVNFFYKFYKIAKDNKIPINENDENDTFTNPTFIMGLLITCRKYYHKNLIDVVAMDSFMKKFKKSDTEYKYDYPLKFKDQKSMLTKFSKLLEVKM